LESWSLQLRKVPRCRPNSIFFFIVTSIVHEFHAICLSIPVLLKTIRSCMQSWAKTGHASKPSTNLCNPSKEILRCYQVLVRLTVAATATSGLSSGELTTRTVAVNKSNKNLKNITLKHLTNVCKQCQLISGRCACNRMARI
jgi:hypothetical protein